LEDKFCSVKKIYPIRASARYYGNVALGKYTTGEMYSGTSVPLYHVTNFVMVMITQLLHAGVR